MLTASYIVDQFLLRQMFIFYVSKINMVTMETAHSLPHAPLMPSSHLHDNGQY